jgi:hypothetical protein
MGVVAAPAAALAQVRPRLRLVLRVPPRLLLVLRVLRPLQLRLVYLCTDNAEEIITQAPLSVLLGLALTRTRITRNVFERVELGRANENNKG